MNLSEYAQLLRELLPELCITLDKDMVIIKKGRKGLMMTPPADISEETALCVAEFVERVFKK